MPVDLVHVRVTGWLLLAGRRCCCVGGAELFVENAAGAARRLGVTVVAVGVLLAGAEPEELLTAVLAALRDRPGLAVGDAIGANVTMLTACLGLAALVRPLPAGAPGPHLRGAVRGRRPARARRPLVGGR